MSVWLQMSIAFLVSIIGSLILWSKEILKFNKLSVYILVLVIYIMPYALAALFIGEIGFFFSKEYVVKNIFLITTVENLIIVFMLGTLMGDILYDVCKKPKKYVVRIIIFVVFTVTFSIFWGMKSYSQINDKNNSFEINYIQESGQELYWNAK